MPKLFEEIGNIGSDISLATSLIFALPAAVSAIKAELPVATEEAKTLYNDILAPAEAIYNDVKVVIQGGKAETIADNAAKTFSDLSALETAAKQVIALGIADIAGEYAKLVPVLSPIASAIGITMPTAILTNETAQAGTATAATPPAGA